MWCMVSTFWRPCLKACICIQTNIHASCKRTYCLYVHDFPTWILTHLIHAHTVQGCGLWWMEAPAHQEPWIQGQLHTWAACQLMLCVFACVVRVWSVLRVPRGSAPNQEHTYIHTYIHTYVLQGKWYPPMIANPKYKGEWKPRKVRVAVCGCVLPSYILGASTYTCL